MCIARCSLACAGATVAPGLPGSAKQHTVSAVFSQLQQLLVDAYEACWAWGTHTALPCVLCCVAAVPMSVDHKPNTREERTRIEDAGGVVVWAGTWRVGGVLAVSRAFGDRPLKRYVIPTPDIREEALSGVDDCLILASDGLWDVISNQVGGRLTGLVCRWSIALAFVSEGE